MKMILFVLLFCALQGVHCSSSPSLTSSRSLQYSSVPCCGDDCDALVLYLDRRRRWASISQDGKSLFKSFPGTGVFAGLKAAEYLERAKSVFEHRTPSWSELGVEGESCSGSRRVCSNHLKCVGPVGAEQGEPLLPRGTSCDDIYRHCDSENACFKGQCVKKCNYPDYCSQENIWGPAGGELYDHCGARFKIDRNCALSVLSCRYTDYCNYKKMHGIKGHQTTDSWPNWEGSSGLFTRAAQLPGHGLLYRQTVQRNERIRGIPM